MDTVFWIAVFFPVYTYLGYPVVLSLLRLLFRRAIRRQAAFPSVSLIVAAYNEAGVIRRKIRNSLALDYPAAKLEILICCDGPTDGTDAIARDAAAGTPVCVIAHPVNRGKVAVLNDAVREASGDILVFSDASSVLRADSVRKLVENFADPSVGAASGRYSLIKTDQAEIGKSEDFYWKYETFLKTRESEISSTLGSHGHLHAIRKELYPFPPPGTINDDYVIPVSVLSKGYRAVFDPRAVGYEEAHEMEGFGRRVRIMAGNLQQLREIRGLIVPFRPFPLFFFVSHKLCRVLVPFVMPAAFVSNLFLLEQPVYAALLWSQILFYALAFAGARWNLKPKILLLPFYFSMINFAALVAAARAVAGQGRTAWK